MRLTVRAETGAQSIVGALPGCIHVAGVALYLLLNVPVDDLHPDRFEVAENHVRLEIALFLLDYCSDHAHDLRKFLSHLYHRVNC
jgi:hypothetical protein